MICSHVAAELLLKLTDVGTAKTAWEQLKAINAQGLNAGKTRLEDQPSKLSKAKTEDVTSYIARAQK
jgi:hypothetical protein